MSYQNQRTFRTFFAVRLIWAPPDTLDHPHRSHSLRFKSHPTSLQPHVTFDCIASELVVVLHLSHHFCYFPLWP